MLRSLTALLMMTTPVFADPPEVVTDIAPIGAIVARVMQDVGMPKVLIPSGASPHDYALRPSEARALASADLVVWVGPALTGFLRKPVDALAVDKMRLTLMEGPFDLLPTRKDDTFNEAGQNHGAHDDRAEHEDHDGHKDHEDHAEHEVRDHMDHEDHDETTADHEGHDHGDDDPHLWLDPVNGVVIAGLVTDALTDLDPGNAPIYRLNFEGFRSEMEELTAEITADLAPLKEARFLVMHDAFHYFEDRFQIEASGAIMASDADVPGPRALAALRDRLAENPVACAFSEPQLNTALINTVLGERDVSIATLNPMGDASLPLAEQYPALLRTMADSMVACLTR